MRAQDGAFLAPSTDNAARVGLAFGCQNCALSARFGGRNSCCFENLVGCFGVHTFRHRCNLELHLGALRWGKDRRVDGERPQQLRCRPTDAAKRNWPVSFGRTISSPPKRASDLAINHSTEVVNGFGKLVKIIAHRCALNPVVATTGWLLTVLSTNVVLSFVLSEVATASSWSRSIRGHRRARKSE